MPRLTRVEGNLFLDSETGSYLALPTEVLADAEAMLVAVLAEAEVGHSGGSSAALEAAKVERQDKVQRLTEKMSSRGYLHDFGGELGEHVLQTRPEDRTNWLSLTAMAQMAVGAGAGNAPSFAVIRSADNETVVVTAAQALDAMTGMFDHLAAIMQRGWQLKDAIGAATSLTSVDAVDIAAGWPTTPTA